MPFRVITAADVPTGVVVTRPTCMTHALMAFRFACLQQGHGEQMADVRNHPDYFAFMQAKVDHLSVGFTNNVTLERVEG